MGLRVNPSRPLWTAVLLTATSVPAPAQFGPPRVAGALGVLAFEGTRGESGVGLMGAAQITLATTPARQLAVEVGLHTLTPVDQACLLVVPAACSPASPASPVWHARVLGSSRFNRAVPLYVTLGLGAYGPVGPADHPSPGSSAWTRDSDSGCRRTQRWKPATSTFEPLASWVGRFRSGSWSGSDSAWSPRMPFDTNLTCNTGTRMHDGT